MKAFITKYALTQGVLEVDATPVVGGHRPNMISFQLPGFCSQWGYDGEWHKTKSEAVARAEEMRLSAIASLKKKLAKLEKLSFQP